ncbi:serine/threonine protein kinase [Fusarium austroafricanum]|uniref:Serine/threonine protein kinase n=1 Tax=Fusarium austroafricanum TaxID=2364996 RepID=A0A8H4KFI8_9HYPO|nr:serine/threonine protein kinase [Fusarium austroafricanum]
MLGSVVEIPHGEHVTSTLGCVVRIGWDFFAITTRHSLQHLQPPNSTPDSNQYEGPSISSPINGDNTCFLSNGTGDPSLCDDSDLYDLDPESLEMNDGYHYMDDIEYESLSEDDEEISNKSLIHPPTMQNSPIEPTVDHNDEPDEVEEMVTHFPTTQELQEWDELDMDWAIIKLSDPRDWRPNAIIKSDSSSDPLFLSEVAEIQPDQETPVLVVTSGGKLQKGQLQPGQSVLGGVSGSTPSCFWTLIPCEGSELGMGDSGSVVIDAESHAIYGHVVGANPMGEVYISPYAAILRQLQHKFPRERVALADPITTLEDLISFYTYSDQTENTIAIRSRLEAAFDTIGVEGSAQESSLHPDTPTHSSNSDMEELFTGPNLAGFGSISFRFDGERLQSVDLERERPLPSNPTNLDSHLQTLDDAPADGLLPISTFRQYVDSQLINGVNGNDETVPFVAPSASRRYWTKRRVSSILESCNPPIYLHLDQGLEDRLQIFSVLVYIGKPDAIANFVDNHELDDYHFPFNREALPFIGGAACEFLEKQWMFFPLIFTSEFTNHHMFPPQVILPVTYENCLAKESLQQCTMATWKVRTNSECKLLDENLVFKVLEGTGAQGLCIDEADSYSLLHRSGNEQYVTKYFSSFSFNGIEKSVIVSEYAKGGSLLDMFQTTNVPNTLVERCSLWKGLFSLLEGLDALHDMRKASSSTNEPISRWHRDIQPRNILVFPEDNRISSFDVRFKLADFGLHKFVEDSLCSDSWTSKEKGNRMYTPPEKLSSYPLKNDVETEISCAVGIWSLGAVFSDVLVWSIMGENGREDYSRRRKEGLFELTDPGVSSHDAYFHDGSSRLAVVQEFHDHALRHRRDSDLISPQISRLILNSMLTEPHHQMSAIGLMVHTDKAIDRIRHGLIASGVENVTSSSATGRWSYSPSRSSHPTELSDTSPSLARERYEVYYADIESVTTMDPGKTSIEPCPPANMTVTVDQLYPMLADEDVTFSPPDAMSTKPGNLAHLMRLAGYEKIRHEMQDRDFIFVIDDSSSMRQHRTEVMRTASVLSYLVANDNGIDLFTTSETTKQPHHCTSFSEVGTAVSQMRIKETKCNMWRCLDEILDGFVIKEQFKPTSILILTDGIWDPDGVDGVEHLFDRANDFVVAHTPMASALTIQFIQFGHDPKGTARLKHLHESCKEMVIASDW